MPYPIGFSNEPAMYPVWESLNVPNLRVKGRDGEDIVLLSTGSRNRGAGPDYIGAVILVNGLLKSGPVELHRKEAEWFSHGQDADLKYSSVILHVVESFATKPSRRTILPTILLHPGSAKSVSIEPENLVSATVGSRADVSTLLARYSWDRFLRRVDQHMSGPSLPMERDNLLPHIFDALGYSSNRVAMRSTAEEILQSPSSSNPSCLLATSFRAARFPESVHRDLLNRFRCDDTELGSASNKKNSTRPWRFNVRPANRPESRIVAGAVLDYRLFSKSGVADLERDVLAELPFHRIVERLVVKNRAFSFVGRDRAAIILVNVVLPALAAHGLSAGRVDVIAAVCKLYRSAPPQSVNRKTVEFSKRFSPGRRLGTSFEQQGAIEFLRVVGSGSL